MKTKFTLLSIIFALFSLIRVNAQQQISNGGFESWTNSGTGNVPTGWYDINQIEYAIAHDGNRHPAALDTLVSQDSIPANVHSGKYAARINTDTVPLFIDAATPGILSYGPIVYNEQTETLSSITFNGVAYSYEPDSLAFWYIYLPAGDDMATVSYSLTEWTGTKEEVVGGSAKGEFRELAAAPQYTRMVLRGHDNGFPAPDTMTLAFWSSVAPYVQGSALWVDDVAFIFNGQSTDVQNLSLHTEVALFPDPVSTTLNIKVSDDMVHNTYTIIDIMGNVVARGIIESADNQLDVSSFASGHYFYTITDSNKKIAAQGRFVINR